MSREEENPNLVQEEDEFLNVDEVAEEVPEAEGQEPEDDDDVDMDGEGQFDDDDEQRIEIDMSNNSWTYFDQHKDSIFKIFSHPTLPMVVTGGGDNTAFMWTTHTQPPRFVGELQGHKESVIAGSFTCDGSYVITGDMNGYIQVHKSTKNGQKWVMFADLEEVEEILWIAVHPVLPQYFAFGANDGSVWCYQIDSDSKSLVQLMTGFLHSLECNGGLFVNVNDPDTLSLVSISEDGSIVNWNCFTGAVNYKLSPFEDFRGVESPWVSIAAYKNVIAVGARDGQLAIINNDNGKLVHSVKTIDNVEDIAELSIEALAWCESDQYNLLAVGLVSGDLLLFDSAQWRLRRTIKLDDTITKLQFLDGKSPFLVGSSMNGNIYKWDARTGEELFVGVGHNMGVLDFTLTEGGNKLITAGDEGVSLVFNTSA